MCRETMMTEPRRSTRVKTMLGAQIIFNNRASTLDCRIRNMSDDGAKIILDEHCAIPQVFEFIVPQRGRTYKAKAIWRQDNEVGLEFLDPKIHGGDSEAGMESLSRLQLLEKENSQLKKRINELQAQVARHADMGI